MKVLLHSNDRAASEATERTLNSLIGLGGSEPNVTFDRAADGNVSVDADGYVKMTSTNPEYIAWAALRQGYVASMKTEPGETAELARICAGKAAEPEPPREWPTRTGMKQNIGPVLTHACKALTREGLETPVKEIGHSFVLEEFFRNLCELGDRFYSGETEVVDEFLQLYCLDRQRRSLMPGAMPNIARRVHPQRLGTYHFIARAQEQISNFIAHHGIARDQTRRIVTEKDVRSFNNTVRVFRLAGAVLEGDGERVAAARRLCIIPVSDKAMRGLEAFDR